MRKAQLMVKKKLDLDKYVRGKQAFMSNVDAYRAAGGEAKAPEQAAYYFHNKPSTQKALAMATTAQATDAMLELVTLSPLAVAHIKDVLESTNPKDRKMKDKVALDVIQRTRDMLPREIKTTHEMSIDEDSQEALEQLASLLLADKGTAGQLIEAIESGEVPNTEEADEGEGLTTEYSVCSSQETTTSS